MSQAPIRSADPRDPAFFQNPYAFYAGLHAAAPRFVWENHGHICLAGCKDVSLLLRDKRFCRHIVHVARRGRFFDGRRRGAGHHRFCRSQIRGGWPGLWCDF